MQVSDEMVRAAMSVPRSAFLRADDWWKSALEVALAAMWRSDFDNAPAMEPVLLGIEGRKLPIAVFRYNLTSPWRYLESGKEVEENITATLWLALPQPPRHKEG